MPFSISSRTTTWAPAAAAGRPSRPRASGAGRPAPPRWRRPTPARGLRANGRVPGGSWSTSESLRRRMRCLSTQRDAAWGTLRRDCGHVRRLIDPGVPRRRRSGRGRLGRSTARLAVALVLRSPRRRTREGGKPARAPTPSRRPLPWYRQPRDRSSAAPRRSPIPSSASVVLSLLARCPTPRARRSCCAEDVHNMQNHARDTWHMLKTSATVRLVASTQKPQAVPSRSRSLLRRPNCLRIRTTPVSAWRTPFCRARSGSACAATTR